MVGNATKAGLISFCKMLEQATPNSNVSINDVKLLAKAYMDEIDFSKQNSGNVGGDISHTDNSRVLALQLAIAVTQESDYPVHPVLDTAFLFHAFLTGEHDDMLVRRVTDGSSKVSLRDILNLKE